MRASKDLRHLQSSGLARVARLRAYVSAELVAVASDRSSQGLRRTDAVLAFATIELDNLWTGIARSLYLSTAFRARDGSGKPVDLSKATTARTTDEALTHAIRRNKGATYKARRAGPWEWRDEPSWWRSRTLLESLDALGASNYQRVSQALGVSPNVFENLHHFRNFYAHRSANTRVALLPALQELDIPTTLTATQALASPAPAPEGVRPQPLILDWLDDMRDTIELLV